MATNNEKDVKNENGIRNGITKIIETTILQWSKNITDIDLSSKKITTLDENVKFPINLCNLNLSNNSLCEVPSVVMKLKKLKTLDISHNSIEYFDDTPDFCHQIETLNLAYNHLKGPPYWIWTESPSKLSKLYLNYNFKITESFINGYLNELMQYSVSISEVNISNCKLNDHIKLLATFSKVRTLHIGESYYSSFANRMVDLPCKGLDICCDTERLILTNTHIYSIKPEIIIFKNILEINLAHNNISDLPQEFCDLVNLEICILSNNTLLYLPDNINKLKRLVRLYIDNNELCMLPETIVELINLQTCDLYNNGLYEVPDMKSVTELDLAQNFFDEPDDAEYIDRKERLRINMLDRFDGRKTLVSRPESAFSNCTTGDEELCESEMENKERLHYESSSSSEDWDSDEYWVPCNVKRDTPTPHSPWLQFVKKKMADGNFCPMDVHPVPIAEIVKYEKICNPRERHESEGQYDDYSDDNS
ncbi:uncharacterized protein ACR2FA_001306 [Aphomia sociella]